MLVKSHATHKQLLLTPNLLESWLVSALLLLLYLHVLLVVSLTPSRLTSCLRRSLIETNGW